MALVLITPDLAQDEDVCAALAEAWAQLVPVLGVPSHWSQDPRLQALHGREPLPRGGQALSEVEPRALEQVLVDIATEVLALAQAAPRRTAPSPARAADRRGRRALWVELVPRGDRIAVRCWNPYHGSYQEVSAAAPRSRDPDGVELFHLLFPDDALLRKILRDLAGSQDRDPSLLALDVRVHIVTADAGLAALPWSRTRCGDEALRCYGWTFVLAPQCALGRRSAVSYPRKVLLWTDDPQAPLRAAVEELLRRHEGPKLSGAQYRHVCDAEAAAQAVRELRPALVLFQGGAPLATLEAALHEHPPHLLVSLRAAAAAEWPAQRRLAEKVLVQLWPRPDDHEDPAAVGRLVRRWLARVLGGGCDAVDVLYEEWPAEGDPLQVLAHYDDLEMVAPQDRRHGVAGPLALDRDEVRALAMKHVRELIDSPTRRVEALIGYGAGGDLLQHLSEQAADFAKDSLKVVLHQQRLSFPPLGSLDKKQRQAQAVELPGRLEQQLRVDAGARAEEPLWTVLRRYLRGGFGGTQVLWLDYGVFGGEGEGAPPALLTEELDAWATFARDWLGREIDVKNVRVVVYLGQQVERAKQERFRAKLEKLEINPRLYTGRFRFSVLPALGRVTLRHLADFTNDQQRSSCPDAYASDVARLVYERSRGEYEEAVKLLRQGEDEGYAALVQALSPSSVLQDDDDDE